MTAVRRTANKAAGGGEFPARVLFTGPAGGKSEKLFQIFEKRLAAENPLEPASYFIVPSREHAERVIKLLITRGLSGFFSQRVTTLDDLIEQAFEVPNPPAVSNLTRIAVMRRIVAEDTNIYFEEVRDKPGFLGLVLDLIAELKESCWTCAAFRAEMNRLKKLEPSAALKYEGLAAFYERYDAALAEMGLRDRRDTLALFRARKDKPGFKPLTFHTLCLDGFFDFTPLQQEYLKELTGAADYFAAALTWDDGFLAAIEPVAATEKMFEALDFKTQNCGGELPRFADTDLAHISRHFLCAGTKPKKSSGGIDWFEAPDPETEAEMISRRILHWIYERNCRAGNIAVLVRSVRERRAVFETVFKRFNIAAEIHERKRLSESEWIQTAAKLVRLFKDGWKKDDWNGFLRSSFVIQLGDEAKNERLLHAWEIWSWKSGLKSGRAAWQSAFQAQTDENLKLLARWFELFAKLEDEWRAAKTAADWARIFKRFVKKDFGMLQFLLVPQNSSTEESWGIEAAAPGRFEKILEELQTGYERGNKAAAFENFSEDFLRLVDLDLFSLPQLNQNAVQVYDVSLARQKEYDVVFLAGLAEKQFPIQIREDALLSDWERRLMRAVPFKLPERKIRQQLEKYLFYLAVTRAKKHLCLSHARRDEEGSAVLPSFYLEELAALFEKGGFKPYKKPDAQPYPAFDEILTKTDLKHAAAGMLFNPWQSFGPEEEKTISALVRDVWTDETALAGLRKALEDEDANISDKKILEHESFHPAAPSPTRLEAYSKCAFRYFSEKILKLQENAQDTRARDQGTVMHNVLQHFFEGDWRAVGADQREAWVGTALEKELNAAPLELGPYQTALSKNEMKKILMRFMDFEIDRLRNTPFQPAYCEYEIPRDKPVTIEAGGQRLTVQGRIDRVDVNAEEKTVVISDYKRSKAFNTGDLQDGVALQLPIYLLAVEKLLGLKPAGGQFLNLKEPKKSKGFSSEKGPAKQPLSSMEFDAVLVRALRFSRRYLDELGAGRIEVLPRDCFKDCGFSAVCRIEKWKLPEIKEQIRAEDKKLGF